jgi:hypothetical protein
MPRAVWKPLASVLIVGCSFSADYKGGHYECSDGVCPTGTLCFQGFCIDGDGGIPIDAPDADPTSLECGAPGALNGTTMGSTVNRESRVSAMCSGSIQNGPDAVYRLNANAGATIHLTIDGSYAVDAYVITPCEMAPATPTCLGGVAATPGNDVSVQVIETGPQFVVVDGVNPAVSGTYTLTATLQ